MVYQEQKVEHETNRNEDHRIETTDLLTEIANENLVPSSSLNDSLSLLENNEGVKTAAILAKHLEDN